MIANNKATAQVVVREWYVAAELAGLPGMPARSGHVPRLMRKLGIAGRAKQGQGGGREYSLSDLPRETQLALITSVSALPTQQTSSAGLSSPPTELRETLFSSRPDARVEELTAAFERKPESVKQEARAALAIVQQYHALHAQGFTWKAISPSLTEKHSISAATLWRWLRKVKYEPTHLWLYVLCDGYAGRTKKSDMSAEAWDALKADFLRKERPTAKACIDRLYRAMKAHPDWIIPARRTLERRLAAIPEVIQVLEREGPTAAKQLYPAQQRLKSALAALEIINGDGYKHNLWVRFPDGEIVRAKTWYWQDVYSGKILTWRTDKTEHTDVIRLSFGDLVEGFGIPEDVVVDNTRAAANKTMTGGAKQRFRFKVREDEPLGVFDLLGVRLHWATPAWGQAKPIERAFGVGGVGEYVDKAPEFEGAWTGSSPLDKPEYDGKHRAIELADLERVIVREVAAWNAREGRRGAMNVGGKSCEALFDASYSATAIRRATEAQRRLWLLATEPVLASSKNGEITLDAGRVVGERIANRYWSIEMADYSGRQVVARFDPARLHTGVHVYTIDGRYICFAECVKPGGFNDANAGREHNRLRKTYLRSARQMADAETRMDALEAAKTYAGGADPVIPAPAAPARGKVVRAEFRDPLERPLPQAKPLTDEEQEGIAALERELAQPAARTPSPKDDWAEHKRWRALRDRINTADAVTAEEMQWFDLYAQSSECGWRERCWDDFEGPSAAGAAA